jgi:hypothetical protein
LNLFCKKKNKTFALISSKHHFHYEFQQEKLIKSKSVRLSSKTPNTMDNDITRVMYK